MVLYSFYKNIFFVVTQFFFGFYNAFSGQPLYEKVIYQMYNILMTSFPIIWFAVFDYEFEKDRKNENKSSSYLIQNSFHSGDENLLMRNPNLYLDGMQKKYFNTKQMIKWISYGIWHALISYLVCFYVITGDGSKWTTPQ